MRKIKFNDEVKVTDEIPVVKLKLELEDGAIDEGVGFLTPFRGYCFRVSNTFEGQGDMGSTAVVGLDMSSIWESQIKLAFNIVPM